MSRWTRNKVSAWKIAEGYYTFALGPDNYDDSGVRGGLNRPNRSRLSDFPYDQDVTYGQPAAYDRNTNNVGSARSYAITPKDTEHSSWDDVEEAAGTPIFFSKGNSSNLGGTVPGTAGSWASFNPDPEGNDEDLEGKDDRLKVKKEDGTDVVSNGGTYDISDDEVLPKAPAPDMGGNELDKQAMGKGAEFGDGSKFPSAVGQMAMGGKFKQGQGDTWRNLRRRLPQQESVWSSLSCLVSE